MQEAGQGVTWIVKPVSLNRGNGIEVRVGGRGALGLPFPTREAELIGGRIT